MKRISLLLLVCFITLSSYAQKVDLDRHYIKVKYTNLPTEPILDESFRTFSVKSNKASVGNSIKIFGFEKLNNEGTVNVDINVGNVIVNGVEISKREVVNKDKEGKVTSTKRYYTPVITYTTKGNYSIANSQGKPYSSSLGSKKTHKGSEYDSYSKASNYYKNNSVNLKDQFQDEFVSNSIYQINKKLNQKYGYEPYTANELFWILDSKKNSDYAGHNKALEDIKTLLGKVSHDVPLDELKAELTPILTYFESVIPNYPEDKKKHRKMKYASYYNAGQLYYHFDMPDKAIEMANKVIENDYDKGDGKRLIKDANKLKQAFVTNKLTSRHFQVETLDSSTAAEYDEESAEQDETPKIKIEDKYIETVFTNADGSKTEGKLKVKVASDVDVSTLDFTKYYKNAVKVYTLTEGGEAKSKNYFARANSSFVANGATYEAVKFASNADPDQGLSINAAKFYFAKVLYKSDKLSVYKYKKELVLMKAGEKKGQSTSSMAYTIGFKKKLAKLVADCSDLAELAKEGSFSNNAESLVAFAQEYKDGCN